MDGKVGPATLAALKSAEATNPQQLLSNLRASREWYERNQVGRNEGSSMWKGLVKRWDSAYKYVTTTTKIFFSCDTIHVVMQKHLDLLQQHLLLPLGKHKILQHLVVNKLL